MVDSLISLDEKSKSHHTSKETNMPTTIEEDEEQKELLSNNLNEFDKELQKLEGKTIDSQLLELEELDEVTDNEEEGKLLFELVKKNHKDSDKIIDLDMNPKTFFTPRDPTCWHLPIEVKIRIIDSEAVIF